MIAQLLIALTGVLALWLATDPDRKRQAYASLLGILGQPAWLYVTWTQQSYGMFFVSVLYTLIWLRGIRNHWIDGRGLRFTPKP